MSKTMYCQADICSRLQKKRVLLLGDFMLDIYTMGQVERISPEAPVPVLQVTHENRVAGGAGNVMLNLLSLGMEVIALGRVGDDIAGKSFLEQMDKEGVDSSHILIDPLFITPQKNRMMAENQQIVRVDHERSTPLSAVQQQQIIDRLPSLLQNVDIVALSDYAKGFLTPTLIQAVVAQASCPVIIDPKGRDFTKYKGATLIKPNLGEAKAAAALHYEASIDEIAETIFAKVDVHSLMITRSKEGISLFTKDEGRRDFPVPIHEVRDVTGAGDTVLAVMTAAMANGFTLDEGVYLSNIGASIAIRRVGCARISTQDLRHQLIFCDPST